MNLSSMLWGCRWLLLSLGSDDPAHRGIRELLLQHCVPMVSPSAQRQRFDGATHGTRAKPVARRLIWLAKNVLTSLKLHDRCVEQMRN